MYKSFVQVSGLCGPQFLIYLLKRFTNLCRALYGDTVLLHRFGAPIWLLEITFSIKALFFFTRELAYVHINITSNTWNGYTAENQDERLIGQWGIWASKLPTYQIWPKFFKKVNCPGFCPRGVLLGILDGDVLPSSPNPDPISDQKMSLFTTVFRPGL